MLLAAATHTLCLRKVRVAVWANASCPAVQQIGFFCDRQASLGCSGRWKNGPAPCAGTKIIAIGVRISGRRKPRAQQPERRPVEAQLLEARFPRDCEANSPLA